MSVQAGFTPSVGYKSVPELVTEVDTSKEIPKKLQMN